ncbi:hypothetical protein [Lichenibacterium dinghuense]|uniref:hypothetical protein n=1 Tax=Lichenibacterium dinghuense TaxID=2895977 RepID=UPI001F4230A9|nr:hypothetical protein [Lichenibacterium sp. 6Y81]
MIWYGKASRRVTVAAALGEVRGWLAEAVTAPLPVERHAAWVSALVEAGGLAQGLADAEGGAPDAAARAMALCSALAGVMGRSWNSGFADVPDAVPPDVAEALASLGGAPGLPGAVEIRRTEGFCHYAVYPEAHWRAASGLAAPVPSRVLGLRSIGTVLAAAVAAALGAPAPRTARPHGHPFAREVEIAPPLGAGERGAAWAVVDEGPGLSGSSMGAAADALARAGVAADRIVLLPGHGGAPGPRASDAHRRLWAGARRAVTPFEALVGEDARGLAAWVADITGPLPAPPEDVGGGGWRRHRYADAADWPAADRQNERRKYLLRGARATVLLRFAGLGGFGRAKLDRARALHAAGFGVEPLALRHGFLVEPWRADLRPAARGAVARPVLLERLAAYFAFRARAFPCGPGDGAPLDALLAMARANAAEALGDGAAARLDGWEARLPALARAARPVAVDGRLAPHEWLHGGGTLLKSDALDHCCGHDLVGCQDVAWDVAGAAVEWDLSDAEAEALRAAVERGSGSHCDRGLVAFFRLAYPAFRVGELTMARDREGPEEAARLDAALRPRLAALRRALG